MRTLRVQLLTVLILIGVGIIGMITWVGFLTHRSSVIKQAYDNLEKQSSMVANLLIHSSSNTNKGFSLNNEKIKTIKTLEKTYQTEICIIDGNKIVYQDNMVVDKKNTTPAPDLLSSNEEEALKQSQEKDHVVKMHTKEKFFCMKPVSLNQENKIIVMISVDTASVLATYHKMQKNIYIIDGILFLILVVIAVFYSRSVIKPLKELTTSINRITDGFLGEKLTVDSYTEIEDVVDSINSMTTKLETLESSRQEFVSNVSHELKTPITSIKVLADSLLQQEDAPAELYREFLVDINAEIERENKIITDLLSLVKMDKTAGVLNIATINISELCEQIMKRIKPIAADRNINLIFESYRTIMAEVDEVKLSLAINNLIENAVKYNYDNGWVRVSLNADHKFFYIKVSDSGVGIPEDEQENVFERFYRVDKARSRETGGTGLGLSITRNAILMHRGAIKVYSKEKEGTTFTVRIPLNYVS
jgi:signal transduction histidine kinase